MKRTPHRQRGGFTLIEVMISLLILSIGLVGVFSMQIVAVQANMTTRDSTEGTIMAEHFAELLRQDSMSWDQAGVDSTTYLKLADTSENTWIAAYGGEPVTFTGVPKTSIPVATLGRERAKFCVAFRLNYAVPGQLMQGWVRVFWPKPGFTMADLNDCGSGNGDITLDNVQDSPGTVAMVTLPITVRRPIVP